MIYQFRCEQHGDFEEWQDINQDHSAVCPTCYKKARRVYTPTRYSVDFTPGFDWGLGEYIDTKRQRENIVAESDLRRIK